MNLPSLLSHCESDTKSNVLYIDNLMPYDALNNLGHACFLPPCLERSMFNFK